MFILFNYFIYFAGHASQLSSVFVSTGFAARSTSQRDNRFAPSANPADQQTKTFSQRSPFRFGIALCGACLTLSACSDDAALIAQVSQPSSPRYSPPTNTYINTVSGNYSGGYVTQYGLGMIKAANLNNYGFAGRGVRVAVIDTGIDAQHADFKGRAIRGTDFGGSSTGIGRDSDGHGTHVTSVIGANRNTIGKRGVAYDVDFTIIKSVLKIARDAYQDLAATQI
jgi:subtilisin family serine protease